MAARSWIGLEIGDDTGGKLEREAKGKISWQSNGEGIWLLPPVRRPAAFTKLDLHLSALRLSFSKWLIELRHRTIVAETGGEIASWQCRPNFEVCWPSAALTIRVEPSSAHRPRVSLPLMAIGSRRNDLGISVQ